MTQKKMNKNTLFLEESTETWQDNLFFLNKRDVLYIYFVFFGLVICII